MSHHSLSLIKPPMQCVAKRLINELADKYKFDASDDMDEDVCDISSKDWRNYFNYVLDELLQNNPPDKSRKVCNGCHNIGHNINSPICKLNIAKCEFLQQEIKKYMLRQDGLSGKTNEEHFVELSSILKITPNKCKTLYAEIPQIDLLDRYMDIESYIQTIPQLVCHQCDKSISSIQINTTYIWNDNINCDSCWAEHHEYRDLLWKKIHQYKPLQCIICSNTKKIDGERFHYDHINMFNKCDSICSMVNNGNNIDDIYKELDRCHVVCLSCHHIVTDIERKMGFTRVKQVLTRKLNICEITEEEYTQKKIEWDEIYVTKMTEMYKEIKIYCTKKLPN